MKDTFYRQQSVQGLEFAVKVIGQIRQEHKLPFDCQGMAGQSSFFLVPAQFNLSLSSLSVLSLYSALETCKTRGNAIKQIVIKKEGQEGKM